MEIMNFKNPKVNAVSQKQTKQFFSIALGHNTFSGLITKNTIVVDCTFDETTINVSIDSCDDMPIVNFTPELEQIEKDLQTYFCENNFKNLKNS